MYKVKFEYEDKIQSIVDGLLLNNHRSSITKSYCLEAMQIIYCFLQHITLFVPEIFSPVLLSGSVFLSPDPPGQI
jgi:hypothetical protein